MTELLGCSFWYKHLTFSWTQCWHVWMAGTWLPMGLWVIYTFPGPLQKLTLSCYQHILFSLWTCIFEGKMFTLKTHPDLSSVLMLTSCAVQYVHKQLGSVCNHVRRTSENSGVQQLFFEWWWVHIKAMAKLQEGKHCLHVYIHWVLVKNNAHSIVAEPQFIRNL